MDTSSLLYLVVGALVLWMLAQRFLGKVAPAKAKALVGAGAKLVDVRSPGEFAAGHVAGALNVPVGEIGGRVGELGDKGGPIVLYCASGMRSAAAKRTLARAGFRDVHDLGPMARWPG